MSGKKICITVGIFPPDVGGPASYVPKIATYLSGIGHSVTVICLSDSLLSSDIYPFELIRVDRTMIKPLRYLYCVVKVWRAAIGCDLIYVNGLPFESYIAGILARVPRIQKVVGDGAWERARNKGWFKGTVDDYQGSSKNLRLKILDWVRSFPLSRTKKIIVPSDYLKRMVEGWVDTSKAVVVYNSSSPSQAMGDISLPAFPGGILLSVCRLTPWKGVDGILKVLKNHPDYRLIVLGDGPMREEWKTLAQVLGVSDRVSWMGDLPRSHVLAYMKKADVFILNSSYEGLPHVVLEAMEMGIPVIATNVGGTGEAVEHRKTGLLIPSRDLEALEKALNDIFSEPGLKERLVENATSMLQDKFSFKRMLESTEKILTSI